MSTEAQRQQWREASRKYAKANKDKINAHKRKRYREKERVNPEWVADKLKRNKTWRDNNHDKVMEGKRKYERKRYKEDPIFKIRHSLQRRISFAIKSDNGVKSSRTMELTGCSIEELCKYIETLWLPGMSWDNYGRYGWHIDHIKPCDSFDLSNEAEQRSCFHYSNLQPLWAIDNILKSNKELSKDL